MLNVKSLLLVRLCIILIHGNQELKEKVMIDDLWHFKLDGSSIAVGQFLD